MKYSLLILCLILLAIILYQIKFYSTNDFQISEDTVASADERLSLSVNTSLKSIRAYSEIIERPLFSKDRKPPSIISRNAASSIDISEIRNLNLYGVVTSSDGRYAIVSEAGDSAERMKVGHVFKGWKVVEINADSVKFESAKGQYELFISPNISENKSSINRPYKNNSKSKSSTNPLNRQSIFRSSRNHKKSPIKINNKSIENHSKQTLSQKELDEINEIGDEGGYHYDPDEEFEDFEDEEDYEE